MLLAHILFSNQRPPDIEEHARDAAIQPEGELSDSEDEGQGGRRNIKDRRKKTPSIWPRTSNGDAGASVPDQDVEMPDADKDSTHPRNGDQAFSSQSMNKSLENPPGPPSHLRHSAVWTPTEGESASNA